MALVDRIAGASSLSEAVTRVPLRLLEGIAEPTRRDLARKTRRAIGINQDPAPISMDPARAFLPPGSVARTVHADLPAMMIGGLSALLLQMLHPLAMAGVANHSNYRADPLGRLRRTADFVGATTFGTVEEAEAAIEQVRRVHRRVSGVAPDGRPYSASDPDLVTFIHAAEMSSFLESARRFGPCDLTPEDCDRYYAEVAPVALALGASWVPRSVAEMDDYFRRLQPELYTGSQAREARDWLRRGVARRPEERAVYDILLSAAISVLPRWARSELGLAAAKPVDQLVDTVAVIPLARAVSVLLRWVATPPGVPRPGSEPA